MENKNKGIYIAILNQGWVRPELVTMLANLPKKREYNIYIGYPAHKPITHNRNTIVKRFLESGMDYLLMIDSDNIPPQNILELADYDKDVIGGLCYAFMNNMIIPLCLELNDHKSYDLMDISLNEGLVECDGIGSGVMMIKKEVLENIQFPFENMYDPEGIKIKGLDIKFCESAKEKGYKVWCHTDYKCSHWTTIDLKQIHLGYDTLRKEISKYKKEDDKTSGFKVQKSSSD